MNAKQLTDSVMMIEPIRFGFNEQTADTNPYQHKNGLSGSVIQKRALAEFNEFVALLRKNHVDVHVYKDTAEPHTPDSIFPNNWVSFHERGLCIIYPMYAENRRLERRMDIIDSLRKKGFVKDVLDLSDHEKKGLFLEGTGSLVLDRINKIAYSCISPRTNEKMLDIFSKKTGYKVIKFRARDVLGNDLYHTNLLMALGEDFAIVCEDAVTDKEKAAEIDKSLKKSGHEVIRITFEQQNKYAGNMLELVNKKGERLVVMSGQSHESLHEDQLRKLEKHSKLIVVPLTTIENFGGGSARCMLAELF